MIPISNIEPIRVLIADEGRLFREALSQIFKRKDGFEVVGQAGNGQEILEMARQLQPDVILMDVQLPGLDGMKAVRMITTEYGNIRVIILTMCRAEQLLYDAISAGVHGFLLKDIDAQQLTAAVCCVHRGGALIDPLLTVKLLGEFRSLRYLVDSKSDIIDDLTEGEIVVLRLVASGVGNAEIADSLGLAHSTICNRLHQIFQKLHVNNRTQATLYALRKGLVKLDEEYIAF